MATYDSCACLPGQLLCVQASCTAEFDATVTQCKGMAAQATSCVLDCSPKPYPVKGDTSKAVVMAVVANIAIQGVSVAQFTPAVQDKFKAAIASALAGVTADKVTIIKVTEVADARRRLEAAAKTLSVTAEGVVKAVHAAVRQLAGTHLEIEFSIAVATPEALKATMSSLQCTFIPSTQLSQFDSTHDSQSCARSAKWKWLERCSVGVGHGTRLDRSRHGRGVDPS